MRKYFFKILLLTAVFALFAACSSEDKYDTSAPHYYQASENRKVAKITVTRNDERSFVYTFSYDESGRISRIDGVIRYYSANQKSDCKLTTRADYLFYNTDRLKISYTLNYEFPQNSKYDTKQSGSYSGIFNEAGTLTDFSTFDCIYSISRLDEVLMDDGSEYRLFWNDGDVSGYSYRASQEGEWNGRTDVYNYSTTVNRTNIDWASFIGRLPFEVISLPCYGDILYSPFYLGAFDMLGARSQHLPQAEYKYDADFYPIEMVTTSGGITIKREISYVTE